MLKISIFLIVLILSFKAYGQCEIDMIYLDMDTVTSHEYEKHLSGVCAMYKADKNGILRVYGNDILENEYLIKKVIRNTDYFEIEAVSSTINRTFRFYRKEKKIETLLFYERRMIIETGSGIKYKIKRNTRPNKSINSVEM